jgi:hypothetical protein
VKLSLTLINEATLSEFSTHSFPMNLSEKGKAVERRKDSTVRGTEYGIKYFSRVAHQKQKQKQKMTTTFLKGKQKEP